MAGISSVAVIGAGPYGLSVSAHLTDRGIDHRIFGPPMKTWREMPNGIFLKSLDFATNIYAPRKGYSLIEYCKKFGKSSAEPCPMSLFAEYGLWAQRELVPHLEDVVVTKLAQPDKEFEIELSNGDKLSAGRVVMATGLAHFAYIPEPLRRLPRELLSHTSHHLEYSGHRGKDVAVVGAGASALEAAVMVHEAGGRPHLITRCAEGASFGPPPGPKPSLKFRILYPRSVLGPSRIGFFLEHVPQGFYFLPEAKRLELTHKWWGPWGPWWLAKRYEGNVPCTPNTDVVSATEQNHRVALRLRERRTGAEHELVVDHVVAGTGYHPDVDAIGFLDRDLASRIRRLERSPKLTSNFESSVPGLYFVGPVAAFNFGPLVRFVAGAAFAAPTVARHVARKQVKTSTAPRVAAAPSP